MVHINNNITTTVGRSCLFRGDESQLLLLRFSQLVADYGELVDVVIAREERPAEHQLRKNAPYRPHVYRLSRACGSGWSLVFNCFAVFDILVERKHRCILSCKEVLSIHGKHLGLSSGGDFFFVLPTPSFSLH